MDSNFPLHDIVIAFELLRGSHTAATIATGVLQVLKDWNIEQYIHGITTNNSSVNDKMFSDIQKLNPVIERTHTQIRCMAHIINLAAQAIVTNLKAEATEHEAVMADELQLVSQPTISSGPSEVLRNCHRIFSNIRGSNLLCDAFVSLCQTTMMKISHPILDMRIRLNSSFKMIDRMLYLRPAITKLVASEKKLQAVQLSSADWALLERLKRILSVFVRAATRLSGSKYPTLQMQLPYYAALHKRLAILHHEEELAIDHPSIATACFESWNILNNYWTYTDAFTSQTIAMILDPRYKIHGFTQMQWEPHWITTAKRQFEAVFKAQYAISVDPTLENAGTNSLALPTSPVSFDEDDDIAFTFGVPVARIAEVVTENKQYLCEATEPHDGNVLHWWRLHAHRYPQLAKMAKDYLSIPAN